PGRQEHVAHDRAELAVVALRLRGELTRREGRIDCDLDAEADGVWLQQEDALALAVDVEAYDARWLADVRLVVVADHDRPELHRHMSGLVRPAPVSAGDDDADAAGAVSLRRVARVGAEGARPAVGKDARHRAAEA